MAYSTLGWQNGQAPAINAENLNHMDQGIAEADATATAAATLAGQKMDKVSGGTAGDFAALDANGNIVDSGKSASDFSKVTATDSGGYLTEITIDGTSHAIPSGGGSAGVSSIGGATGAISLGTGMSMSGQTLNGPDLSGFVEKQTTTAGGWRAYVYNNAGDNSLLVMSGLDGTFAPTATGNIVATTSGRIRTNTPTGPYHATNKQYVDDNFFQKAVVTPSLSTYQDINGYTWQELYTAMQNAGASPIYLNNADRWLHFGTNQVDTICNQIVTFAFDEILGNKFFFVLKYVKEQSGTQTIQEIQCSITSTGVISAA